MPLTERIEAAVVNGFGALSLSMHDYSRARSEQTGPGEIRRRARDRGLELSVLDGAIEWYPHEPPRRSLGGSDYTVDDILRAGEAFEVSTLNALAPFQTHLSTEGIAEHFANLCDRAAEFGIRVHFEFTPKSPVPDVATAWELVQLAGRPNGGILLDTWHFYRVNPDFEALARVPGERVFAVQVSDGATDYVEGLIQDTFRHRRVPGEGDFDLLRVLRALDDMGRPSIIGPEVLSQELFELPPVEAARRAAEGYNRLLDAAGTTSA